MVAPNHRRALAAALGASAGAALLTVAPAAASASPLSASSCATSASLSEPFAPWGDTNLYRVMPGGSFSDGAPGWTLGGGASIVATDDPFDLAGGDSPASLSLPAGGSAQSPFTCVDSSQPTVRFVDAGSATTALEVQVLYQLPGGSTISAPAAVLTPGASWDATPIIQDGATLAGLLSGGTAQMSVRLTAIGGPAQVDDVFVDPKMHG